MAPWGVGEIGELSPPWNKGLFLASLTPPNTDEQTPSVRQPLPTILPASTPTLTYFHQVPVNTRKTGIRSSFQDREFGGLREAVWLGRGSIWEWGKGYKNHLVLGWVVEVHPWGGGQRLAFPSSRAMLGTIQKFS